MIDLKYRGANDLEVIIHKLRNYADTLENKIKEQDELIKQLKDKIKSNVIS
jgi:peptidoglycan hydrolase CwlO-like protein